jgi:hypothetical protein
MTPMATEVDKPVYSERYVAFVDILGFSNIVRESVASPEQAKKLIERLRNIRNISKELIADKVVEHDDFMAQSFSDCIVLSENATPTGLFHLLFGVTGLCSRLLIDGMFTRGGIAKGKLHHSDEIVFGPAMLEAYRLESSLARHPRVLVDKATHLAYQAPEFAAIAANYGAKPIVKLAADGPAFVDILHGIRLTHSSRPKDAAACRQNIQTALDASVYEPHHYKKARWAANYWNKLAADCKIDPVEFPHLKKQKSD